MKDIISPVDTDDGLFHDGDPTTETEGTIVYAKIMNDLQGATIDLQTEMKTLLAAAGFTPDPTKENQLLAAIKKIIDTEGGGDFLPLTGGTLTGALNARSAITVYEDDVNTVSEFLYSYKENGAATKKIGIKAICDADGAGHWVVDVNPAARGDSRVQAFGIDGKSKLVTTMNGFQLYEGSARVYSPNNKPTADDMNAVKKTGDTMTGALNVDAKISLSGGLEIGNQKTPSPAYIDFHTDGTETDYNARIISPQGSTELQLIAADNANNGSGIIRMLGSKADQLSFALQGTAHSALAWRKWGSAERPTVLELDIDGGPWLIGVDHTTDNKAALGVNGVLNCEGVNVGSTARMAADGNIWGTRWNSSGGWLWDAITWQVQNIGQMSVNGTQWWAKINLNGGTLIVQGGYAEVQDAETTDRIGLNIAVPNRLLGVFITNKNFAQGYATYNPQVTDLTNERDGFNFVHGQKEHMMYWIAVGY